MTGIDNPSVLQCLRKDVEAMPPGALLPRDWVLGRLSDTSPPAPSDRPPLPVDLRVVDLAKLFGKRPSTVRAWLERDDFPGAYKLHGKEWRVPPSGIGAFQKGQRSKTAQADRRGAGGVRLSAWRNVRRTNMLRRSETGHGPATNRPPAGNAEDWTGA